MNVKIFKSLLLCLAGIGGLSGDLLACHQQCNPTGCQDGVLTEFYAVNDLNPDKYLGSGETYESSFDLDSYVSKQWDISSEDIIVTAYLKFYISDDECDPWEFASFTWDGVGWTRDYEVDTAVYYTPYSIAGLIGTDHILNYAVQNTGWKCSDFYLTQVTLSGKFCDITVAPVPEPTTAFLFGVGLIGLVAVGRAKEVK